MYRHLGKRGFDLVIAGAMLVLLSPILVLLAIAVHYFHGPPILFRQVRPGFHGRPFMLLKFRTMSEERNEEGVLLSDAQRLTRFGRFLRDASLDELPELINVIRGDMSLVGPRPLLMEYLDLYTEEQRARHDVRPGITGWAQINGRNTLNWEEKFILDLWYKDHLSFSLDLSILLQTLWVIIRREGIGHHDEATMPRFEGTRKGS